MELKMQLDIGDYYKTYLKSEWQRRTQINPRYSMRAFARYLSLDVAQLSRLLMNKQTITMRTAEKICENLKLDSANKGVFLNSVAFDREQIYRKATAG